VTSPESTSHEGAAPDGTRHGAVSIVIPALNEAGNIAAVVTALLAEPVDRIIVVDNGSTDDTAAVARAAGADVISEPRRGYGFACAAGTRAAFQSGSRVVVYIDADQSSLPSEVGRLLGPLAAGDADLVLGSRTLGTVEVGAMGVHQRFGNWLTAAILRRLYRVRVTDLGPYRAIRADLLQSLDMSEMTFGWPTEMMVKSARRRARIVEVPVSWHSRKAGASKVSGTVKGTILAGFYLLSVTVKHAFGPNPPLYVASDE
jgi:glycosyltransferase involved in cell wall biosynthesis